MILSDNAAMAAYGTGFLFAGVGYSVWGVLQAGFFLVVLVAVLLTIFGVD